MISHHPDLKIEIEDVFGEDDRVALRLRWNAAGDGLHAVRHRRASASRAIASPSGGRRTCRLHEPNRTARDVQRRRLRDRRDAADPRDHLPENSESLAHQLLHLWPSVRRVRDLVPDDRDHLGQPPRGLRSRSDASTGRSSFINIVFLMIDRVQPVPDARARRAPAGDGSKPAAFFYGLTYHA